MPKQSAIWLVHPGMLVDLLPLVYQYALGTSDTVACIATLLDRLILTYSVYGYGHEKGCPKLYQRVFQCGA